MTTWNDIPIPPVTHPSSGNLQGVTLSSNLILNADVIVLNSTDPSSLGQVIVTGTPTVGDVLTLNFKYNSSTVPITYTVVTGDTINSIAAGLCSAITAQTGIGGTLTGQVLYAQPLPNLVNFDFDCRTPMSMTTSVSGAHTEILTLAATDPAPLPIAWDNNPVLEMARFVDGVPPPAGSVIGGMEIGSSQSNSPHNITVLYGDMGVQVQSSTSGALISRWFFNVPDNNGSLNRGAYIGYEGVYPVSDNNFWCGHQSARWNYVWAYIGDFKTGLTVNNKPGLTTTVNYAKPGSGTGTLTFTGGILTAVA